ncbi:tautomerase family protein [Rhizobium sp. P38BS-XIX]|uniref:tautomerase family protein n=1 Tax=Rhizobium sp. P38BS-XIX TaxID=2726740 RepID=UPI0014570275|nr:tautomerase family protein [Rhizobium sp. P38BS-XIX]NLR97250.1 tautomerase family protein [Rhizobium sp. P38BS-XIX]
MPLTHIALRSGRPESYRMSICDGVHRAMSETFNVPENNDFLIITEHEAANFRYDATYLGVARSDDLVFIQITANNTRNVEQKKALFQRIAQLLSEDPGLRPEDVFISLVEVERENWSLGHGLAQYA